MKKILDIIEKRLMPPMTKMANQTHMKAVRSGMVVIIPLVIVGSFFLLALNLPFPGYADFIAPYSDVIVLPFRATVFMMAFYVAFGIGSALGKERGLDPTTAGILALVGFMMTIVPTNIVDPEVAGWYIPMNFLGGAGLFGAIIISLVSVDIFYFMKKKNLIIKMPKEVPSAVADSFAALWPTVIVIFLFWGITSVMGFNIHEFFNWVFSPLQSFLTGGSLIGIWFIVILVCLLWASGIHGLSVIGGIARPFWQIALEENIAAVANGVPLNELPNIAPEPFYQWFIWIGGAGATLSLLIVILLFAKSKLLKSIAKMSFVPGLFNINEPVIFGIPIVLNPILAIPFILAPLAMATIAYFAVATGLVVSPFILAPWTLPAPIGAFFATTDYMAIILVTVNILVGCVIYYPFVKLYDKQLVNEEKGIK